MARSALSAKSPGPQARAERPGDHPGTAALPSRGAHPSSFSPTALKAFDECPRRYAYMYVEKEEGEDQPSPQLVQGDAVHQALSFLFRLPVADRSPESASRALRHYWARIENRSEAFFSVDEEISWGQRAIAALEAYCQANASEFSSVEPVGVEQWLRCQLSEGLAVGGKADRVDRVDESAERPAGLRVVDYKTGKCRLRSGKSLAGDRGAQVYALAASRTFHLPVVEVRFDFLAEGRQLSWELGADDLAKAEAELIDATDLIVQSSQFEARPKYWCRWCSFRSICPEGSGQVSLELLDEKVEVPF